MASSIEIKVATFTSTIVFGKTDTEVAQILLWFIKDKAEPEPGGLTVAQLNQWRLDKATAEIVRMVRQEAARVRLRELQAAQLSIETQAFNDVDL